MLLFNGIIGYLFRLFLIGFYIPPIWQIIVFLITVPIVGYYWYSKRDGYFLWGVLTTFVFGVFIGFLIGYSLDRFFLSSIYKSRYGFNELTLAVTTEKPETIKNILAGGYKANIKTPSKRTPLMMAAEENRFPQVCNVLIDAGAKVDDADENGNTPLIYAAMNNFEQDVTKALIQAGADVNKVNKQGVTALMLAARNNPNPEVIRTLLKNGANPKILDKEGKSVFDYAYELPNEKLLESEVYDYIRRITILAPKV